MTERDRPSGHLVAGIGSKHVSFGGPPGGGISSTGSVMPPPSPHHGGDTGFDGNEWGKGLKSRPMNKSVTVTPWSALKLARLCSETAGGRNRVSHSPENGLVSKNEGWQTGRSLSHSLPGGNHWTQKIGPPLLPTASPADQKLPADLVPVDGANLRRHSA